MVQRELHLHRYDSSEVTSLPSAERVVDYSTLAGDIFICALGFEQRCTTVASKLAELVKNKRMPAYQFSICAQYSTNATDNAENNENLNTCLSNLASISLTENADDPHALTKVISETLRLTASVPKATGRIVFDISSCSGALIMSVTRAVLLSELPIQLVVVYTQADKYFPSNEQYERDPDGTVADGSELKESRHVFAEAGAQEPTNHPLFAGHHNDGRPDFILAFPSFRSNRLVRCLDVFGEQLMSAPDKSIFWVFGRPVADADSWRGQLQRKIVAQTFQKLGVTENRGEGWFTPANSIDCCTFDYRDATRTLLNFTDRELGKNISLIPMGTKLQNLGLTLALLVREEVAVITAKPSSFNAAAYSIGSSGSWVIQFPENQKVLAILKRVDSLTLSTDKGTASAMPFGQN